MAEPTLLPGQDDPDIRLFTELGGGRLDAYGVEWLACDPYPTWYRWAGKSLIQREILWGDSFQYHQGKWWDNPDKYVPLRRDSDEEWRWYSIQQCVEEKICPVCAQDGWNGKYRYSPDSRVGLVSGCYCCGFCY